MVVLPVRGYFQSLLDGIWVDVFFCAVLSVLVKCRVVNIQAVFFVERANKCVCLFYLTDKKNKITF